MYRSHNCGELRRSNFGDNVILSGWIHKIRDLGSIIFIDLRDMYGITQLKIFDSNIDLITQTRKLFRESVIQIEGKVIIRVAKNFSNPTGDIEIQVEKMHIINMSILPPFLIEDETDGNEELRMKYRYLDIRRQLIKKKLIERHNIALIIRNYLSKKGFLEIETPLLVKSTPEGARDFIIPSRIHKKKFYALPQSPQLFKQLLIIGGIDKYFQLVKCFRDEDLRSDRQPEFTQIDCEMAFIQQKNIINIFEKLLTYLFKKIKGIILKNPWPSISYHQAIKEYGSDKPDIRFTMKIVQLNSLLMNKGINILNNEKFILGIAVTGCADYSLKQINQIKDSINTSYLFFWIKYLHHDLLKSPLEKFLDINELLKILHLMNSKIGDLILIISGKNEEQTYKELGKLRIKMAEMIGLRNPNQFTPLWITDFPLFKWNKERKKFLSNHHPFTAPKDEDLHLLENAPNLVRSKSYDMIINGHEIGGGSIRIHNSVLQKQIFKILGIEEQEITKQFGFLIQALKYGAPPHGGIAIGFDRLLSILLGDNNIKEYIAFPKNNLGKDIMMDAPSYIDQIQLEELEIKQ